MIPITGPRSRNEAYRGNPLLRAFIRAPIPDFSAILFAPIVHAVFVFFTHFLFREILLLFLYNLSIYLHAFVYKRDLYRSVPDPFPTLPSVVILR